MSCATSDSRCALAVSVTWFSWLCYPKTPNSTSHLLSGIFKFLTEARWRCCLDSIQLCLGSADVRHLACIALPPRLCSLLMLIFATKGKHDQVALPLSNYIWSTSFKLHFGTNVWIAFWYQICTSVSRLRLHLIFGFVFSCIFQTFLHILEETLVRRWNLIVPLSKCWTHSFSDCYFTLKIGAASSKSLRGSVSMRIRRFGWWVRGAREELGWQHRSGSCGKDVRVTTSQGSLSSNSWLAFFRWLWADVVQPAGCNIAS